MSKLRAISSTPDALLADDGARSVVSVLASPLEGRVSFQVHRVNAKLAQVANSLFRNHKLDLISSRILVLLLEHEQMRVGELVDLMVLPQSTISHQLQRLDKHGLIRRRRVREDNRSVAVSLTPAGRLIATECNALSLNVYRHITEGLDDTEINYLGLLLGKMFNALESFDARSLDEKDPARTQD
jgi:MarR family transcriptional regulator, organic hydroperoxide resistance regulator